MQSSSSPNFSCSARRFLAAAAFVGLGASSFASAASSEAATFGDITSANGECVVGNPNTYISTKYLDWVWDNRIGPNVDVSKESNWKVMDNKNWIMDHIVHNNGTLNYCVRWDSIDKLSKSMASKFQDALTRQYKAWNHWLIGYNCWPHEEIKVNIVGFAVKDASLLDWTDDSLGKIYEGDLDNDGVPQCPQSCYRFYDNGISGWSDTSACKSEPFDVFLQPKKGLDGGFGYDYGQAVNQEDMLSNIDGDQLTIIVHEIGHGFGLPDFYEANEQPGTDFPNCLMKAGSSMTVTDSDGWMLRRVLEHLKPRYNF
ncbi:hypothetical protein JM16_009603 [Phytophthora kernoviae]|uniref:Neutral zinc metallopeptidase n=1 Tax=Phytophthora kernoviae TaxID=325452 RepID=A0A8T0LH99_9STRA|nr:hypothetical protein JM16_009603 [Phytophthora kernoviae]